MASLVIYEESTGQETIFETYELTDTSILIGSDSENHLVLETPDIDPSHASLELRDGHWVLQDLGGPGGTAVNGHIIDGPFTLYHGDLIELNQIKMKFQDPERSTTQEFPRDGVEHENDHHDPPPLKGRVWFAGIAGITLLLIFVILVLIIAAHLLGIISMTDLLPPWLTG